MSLKDLFIECARDIQLIKDHNWFEVVIEDGNVVRLDYGPIDDNQTDQCIATIKYELKGDLVLRNKQVHS